MLTYEMNVVEVLVRHCSELCAWIYDPRRVKMTLPFSYFMDWLVIIQFFSDYTLSREFVKT